MKNLLFFLILFKLIACNGGGGSNETSSKESGNNKIPTTMTIHADKPIAGLEYHLSLELYKEGYLASSRTDSNGTIECFVGDLVIVSLYDIPISFYSCEPNKKVYINNTGKDDIGLIIKSLDENNGAGNYYQVGYYHDLYETLDEVRENKTSDFQSGTSTVYIQRYNSFNNYLDNNFTSINGAVYGQRKNELKSAVHANKLANETLHLTQDDWINSNNRSQIFSQNQLPFDNKVNNGCGFLEMRIAMQNVTNQLYISFWKEDYGSLNFYLSSASEKVTTGIKYNSNALETFAVAKTDRLVVGPNFEWEGSIELLNNSFERTCITSFKLTCTQTNFESVCTQY